MKTFSIKSFMTTWTLIMVVCTLGWAYITMGYSRTIKHGNDSANWPTTDGLVLAHKVDWRSQTNSSSRVYFPLVKYQYEVNDQIFTRDHISFFPKEFGYEEDAAKFLSQSDYAIGSNVKVFYKPESPDISILEPGAPYKTAVVVGFFVSVWAGFAYIVFSFSRSFAKAMNHPARRGHF